MKNELYWNECLRCGKPVRLSLLHRKCLKQSITELKAVLRQDYFRSVNILPKEKTLLNLDTYHFRIEIGKLCEVK
jgi:hypothetical protein